MNFIIDFSEYVIFCLISILQRITFVPNVSTKVLFLKIQILNSVEENVSIFIYMYDYLEEKVLYNSIILKK